MSGMMCECVWMRWKAYAVQGDVCGGEALSST